MEKKQFLTHWDPLGILAGKWTFALAGAWLLYPIMDSMVAPFLGVDHYIIPFLNGELDLKGWELWPQLEAVYRVMMAVSLYVYAAYLYSLVFEGFGFLALPEKAAPAIPSYPYDPTKLQLVVGLRHNQLGTEPVQHPGWLTVPEPGLFQNMLVTGTIGTGKTASALYPFLKQLMGHQAGDPEKKPGMLVLDVKGNFYVQLLEFARAAGRERDVVVIAPASENTYNPLHKPDMDALDLAERCYLVTEVVSASGAGKNERFWRNKSTNLFASAIRLARATNPDGYITMHDIHRICSSQQEAGRRMDQLTMLRSRGKYTDEFEYGILDNYFRGEFLNNGEGSTIPTVMATATEMTEPFVNSKTLYESFCPPPHRLSFTGFTDVINSGKIVVLAMNGNRYPKVASIMAAYAKLDFQAEVLSRTEPGNTLNRERPVFLICDEYQQFVTSNDAGFYGLSRESRCSAIVTSQSYSSLRDKLGSEDTFNVLIQNLVNKIWLRTDDKRTVELAQTLSGKHQVKKYSHSVGENTGDTQRSRLFGDFISDKATLTESTNVSFQEEHLLRSELLTRELAMFQACCFLAGEDGMQDPTVVHLTPHFREPLRSLNIQPN